MVQVLGALTPIVLLVAGGALLLKLDFYGDRFRRDLDRLVYWVAVPALVVEKLAGATSLDPDAGTITAAFLLATTGAIVVGYLIGWAMRLPGPSLSVLVQAGFRGNLAFLALPVIVLAVADSRFDPEHVETQAILVLAPAMLFYNVVAVLVLELGRSRIDWSALPRMARSIATNPILVSCVVGIALGLSGLALPAPLDETLSLLGATAAPLALLSLGGTLVVYEVHANLVRAVAGALIKVGVLPVLAWLSGRWFGLDDEGMLVLMVYASAPTAVASYVMASQLGGNEALAASSLVISTLLCAGSLAVALSWAL
ncbi:MAG: AEC family transporter [Polyangiales bacterium]